MPGAQTREEYQRAEVRRMLDLSERQLRRWEDQGLATRRQTYSFSDLVVLRTLTRLREAGVSSTRIKRAVAALRAKLRTASDPLVELKVFSDGKKIAVQIGSSKMEPVSGQLLLDFGPAELHQLRSFPKHSEAAAAKGAERVRLREASQWFEKALELERTGAPVDQVMAAYRQSTELDPGLAGAHVNLGTIYFHMRDWDAAERHYRHALEADSDYALAHFNLGNLFDEKGEHAQALLHYLVALRLDPEYADAHYNVALLYQSIGQILRAVRHWKAYLKLDPSSSWAAIARQELERLRRATVIEGARRTPEGSSSIA